MPRSKSKREMNAVLEGVENKQGKFKLSFIKANISPDDDHNLCDPVSSDEMSEFEEGEAVSEASDVKKPPRLESDFYGLFSLKFSVSEGTLITEAEIAADFGAFGEVLDIWGAGFVDSELKTFDSEVFVRFGERGEAASAWAGLSSCYRGLSPAISDVLPDNFGYYTISFINKVAATAKNVPATYVLATYVTASTVPGTIVSANPSLNRTTAGCRH